MKVILFGLLLVAGNSAFGAGYSAAAVPTRIDVVRSEGFMIDGAFSNPGACTFADRLFVKSDHPQYKQIYAAALAAFATKRKISAYVHGCETLGWYSGPQNTFNIVHSYSALSISD
jgi:hypothetical protein